MNAGGTLLLLILFIIVLGVAWVYTGGPDRPIGDMGAFFQPTFQLGSSTSLVPGVARPTFNLQLREYTTRARTIDTPVGSGAPKSIYDYFFSYRTQGETAGQSPYAGAVTLAIGRAKESDPKKEYIIIKTARNANSITITGWTLHAVGSGLKVKVGEAAQLPFLGEVNYEGPVTLPPQSTMYVTTGRSPNGTSFRTNACTGYFEQFQDFEPNLPKECPKPSDEMLLFPEKVIGNDLCIDFVKRLPQCTLRLTEIPGNVGSLCQDFILNQLSYSGCITKHRYEAGFYKNEWRMFLNRDQELWKNSYEQIRLLDENGKVVATLTY